MSLPGVCRCDGYAMSLGGPRDPSCPVHGHEGSGASESWSDEAPSRHRVKYRDPSPTTPAGQLLARLRTQPGRWLRVAENVGGGWWWSRDAGVLTELCGRRRIAEYRQDPTSLWRRDVWARALTPDEIESTEEIETT